MKTAFNKDSQECAAPSPTERVRHDDLNLRAIRARISLRDTVVVRCGDDRPTKVARFPTQRRKIAQAEAEDGKGLRIDLIDRRILHELQNDGRLTNLELAERIGLSASPCLRRMKRLEEQGVLSRYVALADPALVGLEVTVFTRVSMSSQGDAQLVRFEKAVASWPEVMECYLMSGEADYQLRVVVPNLAAYESFLRQRLTPVPGIAKIQSSFAFRPVIYRTELPIP